MIYYGLEQRSLDSYFQFKKMTAPGVPQAGELRVYSKDKSGLAALYLKDDAGIEREIGLANTVTGTGTSNRITYWSSASVIAAMGALTSTRIPFVDSNGLLTDSAQFTWTDSAKTLAIAGNSASTLVTILSGGSSNPSRISMGRVSGDMDMSVASTAGQFSTIVTAAGETVIRSLTSHIIISSRTASGDIKFTTGAIDTLKALISSAGSLVMGNAALSTSATDGFIYLGACAGTPTGIATGFTGRIPLVYDSTNDKLYAYNSGWKNLTSMSIGGAVTSGTTGSVLFIKSGPILGQDNATFFWDTTNKRLGIGTASPSGDMTVASTVTTTARGVRIEQYSADATSPSVFMAKSRNASVGSHTAVQADDAIGNFSFAGSDGSSFGSAQANILCSAAENWDGTHKGTYLWFRTTPKASTTVTECMRLLASGHMRMKEFSTDPGTGDLSSLAEFCIYMKNDKFVIAYNNGGTVTYIKIPMDGSTTAWAHDTTAP